MTNREFAMFASQIARRSASWTHDTLTMGDEYWNRPTLGDSRERFCRDIREILELIETR